jgi:hypothetical protein
MRRKLEWPLMQSIAKEGSAYIEAWKGPTDQFIAWHFVASCILFLLVGIPCICLAPHHYEGMPIVWHSGPTILFWGFVVALIPSVPIITVALAILLGSTVCLIGWILMAIPKGIWACLPKWKEVPVPDESSDSASKLEQGG